MKNKNSEKIRNAVRENYGKIAASGQSGCCCVPSSCCSGEEAPPVVHEDTALEMGYTREDVEAVPEGSDLGLGCGNPLAISSLKPGETVLDLGSGAGFDCFLAARKVGAAGLVIGVDMTPEMVAKARENALKSGMANVEFRLGEIEHLPVADNSVDMVISNCVINLSPDKQQVFHDAFRVLKGGGRLTVSDIVSTKPLPDNMRKNLALYTGCISGAALIGELKKMLAAAGFVQVSVAPDEKSRNFIRDWIPGTSVAGYIVSATITAQKPE